MENTQSVPATGLSDKLNQLLIKYPIILQVLKFGAIGVINTALDFLVYNFVSTLLEVDKGVRLGWLNIIGFSLAVIQSYFWNRYWAFAQTQVSVWKNFWRLVAVGLLGFCGMVISFIDGPASLYLVGLLLFLVLEVLIWEKMGISKSQPPVQKGSEFALFLIVSIIGALINSGLVTVISQNYLLSSIAQFKHLNKNISKLVATLVSLVWNFIGYKIFVFKKPAGQP